MRINSAGHLPAIMGFLARAHLAGVSPLEIAAKDGAPPDLQLLVRAATGAVMLGDVAAAGALRAAVETFIGTLRGRSIFYTLLADGAFVRAPIRTRLTAVENGVVAYVVSEGRAKPVSRIGLDAAGLERAKATSLIVLTREAVYASSPALLDFLTSELQGAVSAAVDAAFIARIIDDGSPSLTPTFSASGAGIDDIRFDLRRLLDAVNVTGSGHLAWLMSADVANRLAVLVEHFPGMAPNGGTLLEQPAFVSEAIDPGSLHCLNAASIAADSEAIIVRSSDVASVVMDTAPAQDSSTPAATQNVSMFQTNSTAVLAEAFFGAQRVRPNALATLTDIAWGDVAS
jgi:hypothetical protein